jgi:hypothetical protein
VILGGVGVRGCGGAWGGRGEGPALLLILTLLSLTPVLHTPFATSGIPTHWKIRVGGPAAHVHKRKRVWQSLKLLPASRQVLLACLDPTCPLALANLSLQILSAASAALHLRQPPAARLLPALAALLAAADAITLPAMLSDEPSGGRDPAQGLRRQPHPQGVCEAVGGLRLLGRLATLGHNDTAIRTHIPALVPKVTIPRFPPFKRQECADAVR